MDPTISSIPTPKPTPAPTPSPATVPTMPTSAQPVTPPTPQVIYPSAPQMPPVAPAEPASPVATPTTPTIGATDPITQPEPAPAPDPIEEALKAPIKPAEPVPGSIGSSVSVPNANVAEEKPPVSSVNFSEPTNALSPAVPTPELPKPEKKKNNKTLIILCIVAGVIVIALAVVFAMQLIPTSTTNTNTNNNQASNNIPAGDEDDEEPVYDDNSNTISTTTYVRVISNSNLPANATSGLESIETKFDANGDFSVISKTDTFTFNTAEEAKAALKVIKKEYTAFYEALGETTDPLLSEYNLDASTITVSHHADSATLTAENCSLFYVSATDGELNLTQKSVIGALEALGFIEDTEDAEDAENTDITEE